jgi:hypothetical protein
MAITMLASLRFWFVAPKDASNHTSVAISADAIGVANQAGEA